MDIDQIELGWASAGDFSTHLNPDIGQLGYRYFAPVIGEFTSFDSFEGSKSDPAHLHKYTYAGSDPINNIDPSGHDFIETLSVTSISLTLAGTITGATLFHHTGGSAFQGALYGILGGSALGIAWIEGPIQFGKAIGIGIVDAATFSLAEGLSEWAQHPNHFNPDKGAIIRQAFSGFSTGACQYRLRRLFYGKAWK